MKRFIFAVFAGLLITVGAFMWQMEAGNMAAPPGTVTLANGKTVEWPPQMGRPYPDLELVDANGKMVKLSDFRGKVIVIEPIGMTCPACNAFAGGKKRGGVKGMSVQGNTDSFADYFPQYAGVSLHDERIVFVNLLLYNLQMKGPTQADAKLWAEHFGLDRHKNTYVLAGGPELVNKASYNLVPGLQLVDKNFILRSDSSGHYPRDDMWRTLMPMVPNLLKEKQSLAAEIKQSMTVEQAYSAIPHRKTRFDAATAQMAERQILSAFFDLTDIAVAERVSAMVSIRNGTAYRDNYDEILTRLAALDVPDALKRAHGLITQAVQEQRQYLARMAKGEAFSRGAPLVTSSHNKLIAAYNDLMRIYPQENAHNKAAFFDHLCALDFI